MYNASNNPALEILADFVRKMKQQDKLFIRLDGYTMSCGTRCAALYWTDSDKPMSVLFYLLSYYKEERAAFSKLRDMMTMEQFLEFIMDAEEHSYNGKRGKVLAFPYIPAPAYGIRPTSWGFSRVS